MNKRKYEAFTLVEMLIVMGILIILMVIGIAAGRFAINRANDVAHQNAADQLYQGLQAYYTDNRAFPTADDCVSSICTPAAMMDDEDLLGKYMDLGAFNGGTGSTYIYFVGGDNGDQAVLVCVSMRGKKADNDTKTDAAYYCNGNGFGVADLSSGIGTPVTITQKELTAADVPPTEFNLLMGGTFQFFSDWDNQTWE